MVDLKIETDPVLDSGRARNQWISVAAYYKAERRGFKPGKALEDWLQAEIEFTKFKIQVFLKQCEEDGGISMHELQGLAFMLGVKSIDMSESKVDLIREIQAASHHRPCFQGDDRRLCAESDCQWRSECLRLIAEWIR